jgi:hypothetical protein
LVWKYRICQTKYILYARNLVPTSNDIYQETDRYKKTVFAKPAELLIIVTILYCLTLLVVEKMRSATALRFEVVFLLILLPFIFLGSMAPTPTWYQYYFAPVPFLILLGLYTLSNFRCRAFAQAAGVFVFVATFVSFVYGSPLVDASLLANLRANVRGLMSVESWTPLRLSREAARIRSHVDSRGGEGAVLTLSPLYAIESGLPIYKEFVTGPFAWRVSHLLPDAEAAERGLPSPSRISSFIQEERPRAVLTGREEELERPLIREIQRLGYQPIETSTGMVIWLSPQ